MTTPLATVTPIRHAAAPATDPREVTGTIKATLTATFPGVAFSVRRGRGTGWSWITVSWTNGPRDADVAATLTALEDTIHVRGILSQRTYSEAATAHARALTARPTDLAMDAACNARHLLDRLDLTGIA